MIICAIDPGGIKPGPHSGTGYAVLDTEGMQILHMEIANHTPFACVDKVEDLLDSYGSDVLVSEDFKPRWGQKFELDSVYLIGALQGQHSSELKLVMPATHMGLVPTAKLTALMKSYGHKVGEGHSRMALSVAVYWAAFKERDPNVLAFLKTSS